MKELPKNWPSHFPYTPWYLDAAADQWDYIRVDDEKGNITGVLPYQVKKKLGLRLLSPPPLCQRLGPYIFYPTDKELSTEEKQAFESEVLTQLAQKIPDVHYAKINWPYELTNGQAWQALGWEQEQRFSYIIDVSRDIDSIWKEFQPSLRDTIRQAEKNLVIYETKDWQIPFLLTQKEFKPKEEKEHLSKSVMSKIDIATNEKNSRKIFIAADQNGQTYAAMWLYYDGKTAYNLLLGMDPIFEDSGADAYLIWNALNWSKEKSLQFFDFEGSLTSNTEGLYHRFGGEIKPYYQFTKSSKWVKMIKSFL